MLACLVAPPACATVPLGLYSVPADACSLVATAGFTIVHNYAFETSTGDSTAYVAAARPYLDAAQRWKLQVLLGLPRAWARAGDAAALRYAIRALRDHPALLAWYEEEMVLAGDLDAVLALNRIVEEEDPAHGMILEEARDRPELLAIGRARMFTWYPVTPDARRRRRLQRIEERFPVAKLECGFWPALQAFGRERIPGYAKRDWVFPRPGELQWCTLAALQAGATGLFYYAFSQPTAYDAERAGRKAWPWVDYRALPALDAGRWRGVVACAREGRALLEILATATRRPGMEEPAPGVRVAWWDLQAGGRLAIVTNETYRTAKLDLAVEPGRQSWCPLVDGKLAAARRIDGGRIRLAIPGPGARALVVE